MGSLVPNLLFLTHGPPPTPLNTSISYKKPKLILVKIQMRDRKGIRISCETPDLGAHVRGAWVDTSYHLVQYYIRIFLLWLNSQRARLVAHLVLTICCLRFCNCNDSHMAYVTSGYACKGTVTMVVNGTIISNMIKIEFGGVDTRILDAVRSNLAAFFLL